MHVVGQAGGFTILPSSSIARRSGCSPSRPTSVSSVSPAGILWRTPLIFASTVDNYSRATLVSFDGMPNSQAQVYFPVLVQIIIAAGMGIVFLGMSFLIGKHVRNKVKDSPYESGIVPTGDARHRFSVKFYLVAMLFILFDMEAIFLYPWAVVYKELKLFGFFEMLIFILFVFCGYFYVWKKGVLDWAPERDQKALRN